MIEFIIAILILLFCIAAMSIGVIFSNKSLKGSCGNSADNPCTCTLVEKLNCNKKIIS